MDTESKKDVSNDEDLSEIWKEGSDNPLNWSQARKRLVVWILVVSNVIAAICGTAFEPALPEVMSDLHSDSEALASFTVSIYTLGYVLGPLLVAPVSEMYGRLYVFHSSFAVFLVALGVCSASKNLALFVVFRAVMGFAGVGFVLLGPAVVADVVQADKRGFALNVMSAGPVVGPTLGPVIGGYIVENTTWRWIFWSTLCALALVYLISLLIFKETYGPLLLERKKQRAAPGHQARRPSRRAAWTRPLKFLSQSPLVPVLALFTALTNSYAQICFATLGTVFQSNYGFTPGQSGLAYFGLTVGFLFCQITLGRFSDCHMRNMEAKHGDRKPEYRLPPIFIGIIALAAGLFWYGWALEARTHWIVPIVGSAFIAIGILYTYLPI